MKQNDRFSMRHDFKIETLSSRSKGNFLRTLIISLFCPEIGMFGGELATVKLKPWETKKLPKSDQYYGQKSTIAGIITEKLMRLIDKTPFIHATLWLLTNSNTLLDDKQLTNIVDKALTDFFSQFSQEGKPYPQKGYPYLAVAHWYPHWQAYCVHILAATTDRDKNSWKPPNQESFELLSQRWCEIGNNVARYFGFVTDVETSEKGRTVSSENADVVRSSQPGLESHTDSNDNTNSEAHNTKDAEQKVSQSESGTNQAEDSADKKQQSSTRLPDENIAANNQDESITDSSVNNGSQTGGENQPVANDNQPVSKPERPSKTTKEWFQSVGDSIRTKILSFWTALWKMISKLLMVIGAIAIIVLIIILAADKSIQITLPNEIFETAPSNFQVYNAQGQPCEISENPNSLTYIVTCSMWLHTRLLADKLWIGHDYEPIDIASLHKKGDLYEVKNENQTKITRTEWPVVFNDNAALPFENNTKVQFFDNEPDCQKNKNPHQDYLLYKQPSVSEPPTVKLDPKWAKVFSGKEELSLCAEKEPSSDAQKFYVTFSFTPNKLSGKRKIVVIAPSKRLASNGIGYAIPKALTNWLVKLKQQESKVPVTLLLIKPNGSVDILLRSEQLALIPETGAESITAKVDMIEFSSNDFRSLYELIPVDKALTDKDFDQVLYLTDSASFSGTEIESSWLGVPLRWHDKQINLSVLTIKNCDLWKKQAKVTTCKLFKVDDQAAQQQLENMLNQLLQ